MGPGALGEEIMARGRGTNFGHQLAGGQEFDVGATWLVCIVEVTVDSCEWPVTDRSCCIETKGDTLENIADRA